MRTVLTLAAVISVLGVIGESRKGWYVALFTISVVLWMVLGAVGGAV